VEVVVAVAVAFRGSELLGSTEGRTLRMGRILRLVLGDDLFLCGLCIGVDGVVGSFLTRDAAYRDCVAADAALRDPLRLNGCTTTPRYDLRFSAVNHDTPRRIQIRFGPPAPRMVSAFVLEELITDVEESMRACLGDDFGLRF